MPSRNRVVFLLTVALSLSIGWGIRGNFGHETGAMIPGALAAIAAVTLAGREDWLRRIGSFGFFGALGWSCGGSISYMQVIAYTHSGHSPSVLYGFACLFAIGFLWAIFGGVGTALPAFFKHERLNALYPLVLVIFVAWWLQDFVVARLDYVDPAFRHRDPLYWYDTDWLGITVALGATLLYAGVRRQFDFGARLVTHLCVGWWCGFALFVLALGWRMTPPRGDNWAGCLGMFGGLCVFLLRERMTALLYCGILTGIVGGAGFAGANCLKLLGISTGWQTNWHSLLEQSYGFINGIGVGLAMLVARNHAPENNDPAEAGVQTRWAESASVWFLLIVISYINFTKNVGTWTKAGAVPAQMYGLSTGTWFDAAYLLMAILVAVVLFAHAKRPLAVFPESTLGRAQLLFLVFLWWLVIGNFERALAGFAPQRLVTEGVIHVHAIITSALILLALPLRPAASTTHVLSLSRLGIHGTVVFASIILSAWGIIRIRYGDTQAGYAAKHIRFGPHATASKEKPSADKPHP